MRSVINPSHLDELVAEARAVPDGCFVEVGVFEGGSAARLAEVAIERGRALWLFDTFTGMPEATPGVDWHQVGDFAETSLAAVQAAIPQARFVVGDARQTLPATDTGPVALAHVDCDQYDTTRTVVAALAGRMAPGGVIVLDDYGCLDGATRAVDEVVDEVIGRALDFSPGGKARVRF